MKSPGRIRSWIDPLPWTGDFKDGMGNKVSMLAYANPPEIKDERQRGDGYGIVRFDKRTQRITLECWPRFSDVKDGDKAQFPGWPVTVAVADNDGRTPVGWLPDIAFEGAANPVVQVIEEKSGDILYTVRIQGDRIQPRVYALGKYTVRAGRDKPDGPSLAGLDATDKASAGKRVLKL
jgi:hypothetical protein